MKIINPSFEILNQEDLYKHIERVGRVCYKSENKITDTSCKGFVNGLIKSGHGAMLEHGTVYLRIPMEEGNYKKYSYNKYSNVNLVNGFAYVTTNYRVIIENNWKDDLFYECRPTENHEKRITVKFTCSCGIAREFTRHRVFSFAQESTRYCNYSNNDKFNDGIQFIMSTEMPIESKVLFRKTLSDIESIYNDLIAYGCKPEIARDVLPLATKTELVMTGFARDWNEFFKLRAIDSPTNKPHPDAKALAKPLMNEFKNRKLI